LNAHEYLEIKRLFVEMGMAAQTIIENNKILDIFIRHFEARMNNGKTYNSGLVQEALKDFLIWSKKRQVNSC
jgi:hypothetical protein